MNETQQLRTVAGDLDEADADALLDHLNRRDIVQRNTEQFTGKQLLLNLGADHYRLVSGTLASAAEVDPLAADAQGWLRGAGLDFSTDVAQDMISQLATAGNWPDEVTAAVRELGVRTVSLAEQAIGRMATPEDVAAVLADYQAEMALQAENAAALELDNQRRAARDAVQQAVNSQVAALNAQLNVVLTAIADWDGTGEAPTLPEAI